MSLKNIRRDIIVLLILISLLTLTACFPDPDEDCKNLCKSSGANFYDFTWSQQGGCLCSKCGITYSASFATPPICETK